MDVATPIAPAGTFQMLPAECQDAPTLEARVNALIAVNVITQPNSTIVGFDAGCQGNGATWLLALFQDTSGTAAGPPPLAPVPIAQAYVVCGEALDEAGIKQAFDVALGRLLALVPTGATIVASRVTGGGAGGKYLVTLLANLGAPSLLAATAGGVAVAAPTKTRGRPSR